MAQYNGHLNPTLLEAHSLLSPTKELSTELQDNNASRIAVPLHDVVVTHAYLVKFFIGYHFLVMLHLDTLQLHLAQPIIQVSLRSILVGIQKLTSEDVTCVLYLGLLVDKECLHRMSAHLIADKLSIGS